MFSTLARRCICQKLHIFRVLWLFSLLFVFQSVITGWSFEALRKYGVRLLSRFSLGWGTNRLDSKTKFDQETRRANRFFGGSYIIKRDVGLPSVRGTGWMAVWDVSIKALLRKQIYGKPFELSSAQLEWLTNGSQPFASLPGFYFTVHLRRIHNWKKIQFLSR